jgi:class 3 adenylate cyclase
VIYAIAGILTLLVLIVIGLLGRKRSSSRNPVDRKPPLAVGDHIPPTMQDITVLCTNLTNSVGLFERLGDLAASRIINDYYAALVPAVRHNGGFVNKFLGDGILALFGVPTPSRDHAAQAVRAVLEMQSALDALNARLAAGGKPPLVMRIGVATGLALVGDAGTAQSADYTAFGDVVNLASRLEQLNKTSATRNLLSDVTASRLDGSFTLNPIDFPPAIFPTQSPGPFRAFEVLAHVPARQS